MGFSYAGTTPPRNEKPRTSGVEFEPHLSLGRYCTSSNISRSTARGPPRKNVSGMRSFHPARASGSARASCCLRTPTPLTLRSRAGSLHVFLQVRHFVLDFKKAAPLLGTASPWLTSVCYSSLRSGRPKAVSLRDRLCRAYTLREAPCLRYGRGDFRRVCRALRSRHPGSNLPVLHYDKEPPTAGPTLTLPPSLP